MPYQTLSVSREGAIAVVTLNRPERRNALSVTMARELTACLDETGGDPAIRAVILAAAGNVFSAGHDLSEMVGREAHEYREIFDLCSGLMMKIPAIPQPVIAEVQGPATAAGCQLVASCDLAIAAEDAWFATPGVKIGLCCATPLVALTRTIGPRRAFYMAATGEPVDARTAAEWGLINQAVPAASLWAATRSLAAGIAEASPLVQAFTKRAFHAQMEMDLPQAYAHAQEVMTLNATAADAQEGIEAFLARRAPQWTGK